MPPINFEVAPLPNAPDHADTDARNRDRLCGRVRDVPGSSHVDERGEMQDIGASRQSENGNAGFKGPQKAVVTHKCVFPVASHAIPSPDRKLLEREQVVVGQLQCDSCQQLNSPRLELPRPLGLTQPGEKPPVRKSRVSRSGCS